MCTFLNAGGIHAAMRIWICAHNAKKCTCMHESVQADSSRKVLLFMSALIISYAVHSVQILCSGFVFYGHVTVQEEIKLKEKKQSRILRLVFLQFIKCNES